MSRAMDPDWEVTPTDVARRMRDPDDDVVLVDCRTEEEYQLAHIDGALLFPMDAIPARLRELEEFEERSVVVHCHSGVRSMTVTAFLREQGFEDVRSMSGGIDAWSVEVDPDVPRY